MNQSSSRSTRWRRLVGCWGPVVVIHVATSVARVGAIAWKGGVVTDELLSWDAKWYLHIAEFGYGVPRPDAIENPLGFFPLFPFLIDVVHFVTPFGYRACGLIAAQLGALAASLVVYALVRALADRSMALWFVALFNLQPMAVSLSMAYTEGLFVALAAGALLAAHRHAWLLAGALGFLAGLTRITGLAVGAAVLVAAVMALRQGHRPRWTMGVAAALACAGAPAYVLWVGIREGDLRAYQHIQASGWSAEWDWGRSTGTFVLDTLRAADLWQNVSIAFLIIGVGIGCLAALWASPWLPFSVYGLAVVAVSIGQNNSFQGKPRYFVPVLLFLLPIAAGLVRARRVPALATLAFLGLFGTWFGAYMLVTWDYAI